MKLEHVFDLQLQYTKEFTVVKPYETNEGSGYGEGEGIISGKVDGKLTFVNHPHFRGDGWNLPDVHGVILSTDSAKIIFAMKGLAKLDAEASLGKIVFSASFETNASQHQWINTTAFVAEAIFHLDLFMIEARIYSCQGDFSFPEKNE